MGYSCALFDQVKNILLMGVSWVSKVVTYAALERESREKGEV